MTSLFRTSGIFFALLILAAELPVLTKSFQFLVDPASRMPDPFPDLASFGPALNRKSAWLLAVDDQPVRGRGDVADAIHRNRAAGALAITTSREGRQIVPLQPPAENPKFPWNRVPGAHWMSRLIWPAVCVLLAIAVLLSSPGGVAKTGMVSCALLLMGHISWIAVSPYEFTGTWRTLLILYECAILTLGPIAVVWCGVRLPSPLFSASLKPVWVVLLCWGLLQTYVNLAELDSYKLLRGWMSWESLYDFTKLMVLLAAACVLVFRFLLLAKKGRGAQLGWSMVAAVLAFCFYFLMGPFLLGTYLETFSGFAWAAGLLVLGFPLCLAMEGVHRTLPTAELALSGTWPEAFQRLDEEARKSGLQLLALYSQVGSELRVIAAQPCGAAHWAPLQTVPEDSDLLLWRKAGERAALVLGRLNTEEPSTEAVDRLAASLSEFAAADPVSARPLPPPGE